VVFDDEVQLAGDIAIQAEENTHVSGHWYGVSSTTAHKASSVWVLRADDADVLEKVNEVCLQKEHVVLNSPEKRFVTPTAAIKVTKLNDHGNVIV
jgi:hypothetical protein